ncbi:replicative DNA helicase [Aeromonas caviae]|uniref:replicative DNA helicase n=1 Tax=Aeromonas caviae TaxID=648 RepID=UPI003F7482FE
MTAPIHYLFDHEDNVIGVALKDFSGEYRDNVMNINPDEIVSDRARWLVRTVQDMARAGIPIDLLSVEEQVAQYKKRNGGQVPPGCDLAWLIDLAQQDHTKANHAYRCNQIRENAHRLRLDAAIERVYRAKQEGQPIADAARAIVDEFQKFEQATLTGGPVILGELLQGVYEGWRAVTDGEEAGLVLESGGLGEAFGRMKGGELVVVAGRPGMGKTVLATAIASDIGIRQRRPVLYLSLEMSAHDMAERLWLAEARLPLSEVEADVDRHNYQLAIAKERLDSADGDRAPFWIEAPDMMNIHQVVASAERWARKTANPAAVLVDYVGLIDAGGDNRRHDLLIGTFTAALKALAKRLNLPVIALFQLNRDVGQRANKRPGLTDLRDSGSIEQDADKVVMIHREKYYDPNTELGTLAELINAKRRRGSPCNGYMEFINGQLAPLGDQARVAEQVGKVLERQASKGDRESGPRRG